MKNGTFLTLLASLLIPFLAYSQDTGPEIKRPNTTAYIAIGTGVGIPVGAFAGSVVSVPHAGYAMNGFTGFAEFAMPVVKSHIGFAARVGYYGNKINGAAATYGYSEVFTINDPYRAVTFMGGAYFTFPVHKFSIDMKLLGGLASCTLPGVSIYSYNPGTPQTYNIYDQPEKANAFAFGGDITVRYAVNQHLCALVQGGIFHADPMYRPLINNVGKGQPTSIVNISAGLGYQL